MTRIVLIITTGIIFSCNYFTFKQKAYVQNFGLENENQQELTSGNSNIIRNSMPHLVELEFINNSLDNPCQYIYNFLGLYGLPKIIKENEDLICKFENRELKIRIVVNNKGEKNWFIKVRILIKKIAKEKLITLTLYDSILEEINSTNRPYPFVEITKLYRKSINCGVHKQITFSQGKPIQARLYCYDNSYDDPSLRRYQKKQAKIYNTLACGQLFIINPNKITTEENNSVFDNRTKCNNECFDIIPFMKPGDYMIRKSNTILRAKPNRNSQIIATYQIDETLRLIEDIGNIEEINFWVAPWVKVKMHDGKEGYIFGALLKKEGEFFPY